MTKINRALDTKEVIRLYTTEDYSVRAVARTLEASHNTITNRLISAGIGIRPAKHYTKNWKGGEYTCRGYVYVLRPGHPRGGKDGYVMRAIDNWEKANGMPFPKGRLPHHKNFIRDDDRSENIEPLTRPKHARLHALRQHNAQTATGHDTMEGQTTA